MTAKFVDLKEAAKILGVTAEELVDLRSRGEIFGYRDGASWKFKMDEVERVAAERSAAGKIGSDIISSTDEEFADIIALDSKSGDDDDDSVLVQDDISSPSGVNKKSTVIGMGLAGGKRPEDSDLKLGDAIGAESISVDSLAGSLSGVSLGSSITAGSEAGDSIDDDSISGDSAGDSSAEDELIDLASESSIDLGKPANIKIPDAKKDSDVLGDIQLQRPGSGTGAMNVGVSADSIDLDIGSGSGSLSIGEDASLDESIDGDEDSISLEAEASKVGSGRGSDVTFSPGDSGINLRSPSDSGLSLDEEPLDLGGSAVDSLELPEDDDMIALEEDGGDPEMATQLKADEAFSLSPVEGQGDDDDSGSQVIALEDSSQFDQGAATMLNQGGSPLLEEGAFTEAGPMQGFDLGGTPGMMQGTVGVPTQVVYSAPVETPYSVWNVLGLMITAGTLALAGMLMVDVMLNMWSFSQPGGVATGLMDAAIGAVGLNK